MSTKPRGRKLKRQRARRPAPRPVDRRLHHHGPTWVDYVFSAPGLCFGILYAMLTIMLIWLAF